MSGFFDDSGPGFNGKDPRPGHALTGQTVEVKKGKYKGQFFKIEDWALNVNDAHWWYSAPAYTMDYAGRAFVDGLQQTDLSDTLYGKIEGKLTDQGVLVHASEISG